MSKITGVDKQSPAHKAGIRVGDELISIAGHKVCDVLDYLFYSYDEEFDVALMRMAVGVKCI